MLSTSESIELIATALAKAQGQMDNADKSKVNPAFKSKYADLASVRDAVIGPLSANGICVLQAAQTSEVGVTVETRLVHSSGQWFACTVGATPADYKPQSIGSAQTYLRRYGLMSMCGIAPEDDDGNAGNGRHDAGPPQHYQRQPERPPERPPEPRREAGPPPVQTTAAPAEKKWTDADRKRFCADVEKIGLSYDVCASLCESLGRPRPSGMDATQRSALIHWLMQPAGVAATKAHLAPTVESK